MGEKLPRFATVVVGAMLVTSHAQSPTQATALPPPGAESAEEMLSSCKQLAEARVSEGLVNLPRDFESGRCWGAFGVFQRAAAQTIEPDDQPVLRVCAPPNSTRTQYIVIFVNYAKQHSESLNEDFFTVAWRALRKAFPCRPSTQK
jgi:hypothetical protein